MRLSPSNGATESVTDVAIVPPANSKLIALIWSARRSARSNGMLSPCRAPSSEHSSFLHGIEKRRPLSALARRPEVEHGPAAAYRLAAQPGVGIHGDWLAHQLEEGHVAGVVCVVGALVEADTDLARDGARPVHLALVDAERLVEPAGQHAGLHLGLDGDPSGRAERPRDRANEEVHAAREEDDRSAGGAVLAHERRCFRVDRRRAPLHEPFLALPHELRRAPPSEIGGRDAPEHGAAVEPAKAVAQCVPGTPDRECGFRFATRHEVAGEEVEPLAAKNDAIDVEECDARCHLRSPPITVSSSPPSLSLRRAAAG